MFIYLYIYLIYNIYNIYIIYIYIYVCMYVYGDTTSKNKLVFATSFICGCSQGICQICDLQVLRDI